MNPIPYGKQHITEEDIAAVIETLQSPFLTSGPKVAEFEAAFAEYIGSKYAVAVANGTAALHISCMALGVNAASKVITAPITFSASANCVRYCGGEVHFADIDSNTILLDIYKVRILLENHPKGTFQGIIPIDFAGYPVDMQAFRKLADEYGLWILEDACHSPGGNFTDNQDIIHKCGDCSLADLAIFSFHPVKHIATGEGGMVTTNDEVLYKKLKQYRSHGMIYQGDPALKENHGGWYMELQELGYNYRMPDVLCNLGISQLKRADEGFKKRQFIAKRYDKAFANTKVKTIIPDTNFSHAYHLYVIQIENRKGLYDYLRSKNIFVQVHYVPVHLMPYYKQFGWKKGDFPNAENYYEHCLSIPMYPTLTNEEQEFVIKEILSFVG